METGDAFCESGHGAIVPPVVASSNKAVALPLLDDPRIGQHVEADPSSGEGCEHDDDRMGDGRAAEHGGVSYGGRLSCGWCDPSISR